MSTQSGMELGPIWAPVRPEVGQLRPKLAQRSIRRCRRTQHALQDANLALVSCHHRRCSPPSVAQDLCGRSRRSWNGGRCSRPRLSYFVVGILALSPRALSVGTSRPWCLRPLWPRPGPALAPPPLQPSAVAALTPLAARRSPRHGATHTAHSHGATATPSPRPGPRGEAPHGAPYAAQRCAPGLPYGPRPPPLAQGPGPLAAQLAVRLRQFNQLEQRAGDHVSGSGKIGLVTPRIDSDGDFPIGNCQPLRARGLCSVPVWEGYNRAIVCGSVCGLR